MSIEKAWEVIYRQIKKTQSMIIKIVIAFVCVFAGALTLIFLPYVGIPIMFAGIILMTAVVSASKRNIDNSDAIYQQYVLREWLKEIFDEIEFDIDDDYTKEELEQRNYWDDSWDEVYCHRAFHGVYKGCKVRGAELALYHMPEKEEKKGKYDFDIDEPAYSFRGRIFEIEGKLPVENKQDGISIVQEDDTLILLYNLDYEDAVYEWWMPEPSADNMNFDKLHTDVINSFGWIINNI